MSFTHAIPARLARIPLRPVAEAAAAAVFAYFAIWLSFFFLNLYGRLAAPATYDDVSYFIVAQAWIDRFGIGIVQGIGEFFLQHAPLSTLVAAVSFLLFGPYDWAPYIANGVLWGIALWAIMRMLAAEGASLTVSLIAAFSLTTTPFAMHAVSEFRPELFTGLLSAFAILILFRKPIFLASRRAQCLFGFLFGAVLLANPPAFAMNGVILALAFLVSSAAFIAERGLDPKTQLIPIAKAAGIIAPIAAIGFVPFLLAQGGAFVAQPDSGAAADIPSGQSAFYLVNLYTALGIWLWIGLATFALRLWATWRFVPRALPSTCGGYAMLVVIYAAIAWTAHKNYFFGAVLYAPFLLLMARDWGWLLMRWPVQMFGRDLYPAHLVLTLCALAGTVFAFRAPQPLTILSPPYNAHLVEMTQTVWAMIADFARGQTAVGLDPHVRLLVNASDPVRAAAIELRALREGLNVQVDYGYSLNPEAFLEHAAKANLIVVTSNSEPPLSGPRMGDAILQAMTDNRAYRAVQTFPGMAVRSVTVFAHADPADPLAPLPAPSPSPPAEPDAEPTASP
jgi:hypothetical protein